MSKDHVHMHIEYPPSQSISDLVKRLKGRTSRMRQGVSRVAETLLGKHFWAIGYGAWSTGNITEELVEQNPEHHRSPSNVERETFILE